MCVWMASIAFVSDFIHATYKILYEQKVKINIGICVTQYQLLTLPKVSMEMHRSCNIPNVMIFTKILRIENFVDTKKKFLHNRMEKVFSNNKLFTPFEEFS